MKRIIYQFLFISLIFLNGCENSEKSVSLSQNNKNNISQQNTANTSSNLNKKSIESDNELTSIDKAQKNYQDSYNEYVRCLRELGPQRIETLQALTLYQKNYHIYQAILKTESEKLSNH